MLSLLGLITRIPAVAIARKLEAYLLGQRIDSARLLADGQEAAAGGDGALTTVAVAAWAVAMGEDYALLVLPAAAEPCHWLNLLQDRNGSGRIRLASESEVEHLFSDCDGDALPPFGRPYGVPVYASRSVRHGTHIMCPTGVRGRLLRLARGQFVRLAEPTWLPGVSPLSPDRPT